MKILGIFIVTAMIEFSANANVVSCAEYLSSVRNFAVAAHGEQKYGGQRYEVHLIAVNEVLKEFGFNDLQDPLHLAVQAAGWVHDVLEDTKTTREEVRTVTGVVPEDLAWRVSDGPGATRAVRKAGAYQKIRGHLGAVIVKLADRLANMRASNAREMAMYIGEYPHFREELYDPSMTLTLPMWAEIDRIYRREVGIQVGESR